MGNSEYWRTVPGAALTVAERLFLVDRAREVEERFGEEATIVNIGVLWGASLHCLREGAPVSYTHLTLPTKA